MLIIAAEFLRSVTFIDQIHVIFIVHQIDTIFTMAEFLYSVTFIDQILVIFIVH